MSFQPPSSKQELQNKKILEDLQQKKQQMMKQLPSNAAIIPGMTTINSSDTHGMSTAQRTALQHAHGNSNAFFITQDSSFGNLILPVLPRF